MTHSSDGVVYVSSDPIQTGVGRSQVLPVVKGLAEVGWPMTVVSAEHGPASGELKQVLKDAGVEHLSVPVGPLGSLGLAKRVARLSAALPRAALFHARSDPSLVSVWLRHPTTRTLWDVRSRWAAQKHVIGGTQPLTNRLARQIERVGTRRSTAIMTLTRLAAEDLEAEWGAIPRMRLVLPTLTDTTHFAFQPPIPVAPIRLMFSGSFNAFYDVDLSWRFCNAVRGLTEVDVIWAREHSSPQSRLSGFQLDHVATSTYEGLPALLKESSAGLSICRMDTGISLRAAVPTKIGEFLATGRPIIVNEGLGDLDELISEHNIGIVISDTTESHLRSRAQDLLTLLEDPGLAHRCRDVAERHFGLTLGIQKISTLYEELLGMPPQTAVG